MEHETFLVDFDSGKNDILLLNDIWFSECKKN